MFHKPASDPRLGHCRTDDGVDGATYWLLFILLQHIVVIMEKREKCKVCMCVCVCVAQWRVFGFFTGRNQCMASNRVVLDRMGCEREKGADGLID